MQGRDFPVISLNDGPQKSIALALSLGAVTRDDG